MNKISIWALCLGILFSCTQEKYYTKRVDFKEEESLKSKLSKAARVVPTQQQLDWQKLEMTAFIHFTVNTFTDMEWGHGDESPQIFNPTNLDCEQWVKSLKAAGTKLMILTAKHHDGFCLWPTKTTKHSVVSSPWKDGKGDVVAELRAACDKYDMKFGLYLSPWDRNAESYGDSPAYNKFFLTQLTELLTNYGKVDEVWFDGACGEGPNGKKQEYDWDAYYDLIYKLQPETVVSIMGEDIRWVGTESGYGRETEWSTTVKTPGGRKEMSTINTDLKINAMSEDLGSKKLIEKAESVFWYPSEVDVSIRPGWFYHKSQDKSVKSLAKLVDIYFNSVGMNSVLLLNVPPDTRGLIHEKDVKALKELGDYIKKTFKDNKVAEYTIPTKLENNESVEFEIPEQDFNVALFQEDISKGQRVAAFKLEALIDGEWIEVTKSTTIGYKKLRRFNRIKTSRLKFTVLDTRLTANISKIGVYNAPEIITEPTITRDREGNVKIHSVGQATIVFTTDGSEPTKDSEVYSKSIPMPKGGTLKVKVFADNFTRSSETFISEFGICSAKWSVVSSTSHEQRFKPEFAIDGNPHTMWHTPWQGKGLKLPQSIVINLGETVSLKGFSYSPRGDSNKSGTSMRYNFYVSLDGKKFKKVLSNKMFNNIKNNPITQHVKFGKTYKAKYFKFESIAEIDNKPWVSVGELGVITK